jgi:hypothetical protein
MAVGEHAGSPLQPLNMRDFVGHTCPALNLMVLNQVVGNTLPTLT